MLDRNILEQVKFLQYFGNMRNNLAVLEAFGNIVKMMNHTGW